MERWASWREFVLVAGVPKWKYVGMLYFGEYLQLLQSELALERKREP